VDWPDWDALGYYYGHGDGYQIGKRVSCAADYSDGRRSE
jgi:hypothetical protein